MLLYQKQSKHFCNYFGVESTDMQRIYLQIRMAEKTLGINTGTMPKTSVSTAARKVCQWSHFTLHSVLLCQKWKKERKKNKKVAVGEEILPSIPS